MLKRFFIFLFTSLTLAVIGVLLLPQSVSAKLFTDDLMQFSDARLSPPSSENIEKEDVQISGILTVFVIDGGVSFENNINNSQGQVYYIVDGSGKYHLLLLSDDLKQQMSGESANLNGRQVVVTGTLNNISDSDFDSSSKINVQSIKFVDENGSSKELDGLDEAVSTRAQIPSRVESTIIAEHVLGTQRFVTILCR